MTDPTIAAAVADATAQIDAEQAAAAPATPATPAPDPDPATPSPEAEAAAADPPAKPDPVKARLTNLTRKYAEADRARELADRRAEAAEALLAATRTADPDAPPPPAPRPAPATSDVETRAAQLLAERAATESRQKVIAAGVKEFGEKEWNDRAAILQEYGATLDPHFMGALLETEHPTRIIATLSDDTDALDALMKKSPTARALALGKMDAAFAKPAARPLSSAPKPAARVEGGATQVAADIYDPKMSMAEFQREMDKLLPVHLGGKRKVA